MCHSPVQRVAKQLRRVSVALHWVPSSNGILSSEAVSISLMLPQSFHVKAGKKQKERPQFSIWTLALTSLLLSRLWQSVNKETEGDKRLVVLERGVRRRFFNIFCPDAQRYRGRTGGAGRCVAGVLSVPGDGALLSRHWLHYSPSHISIPHPQ